MTGARLTPKQRHRQGVLARYGHTCRLAQFSGVACTGRIEAAHWISVSFLRSHYRGAASVRRSLGWLEHCASVSDDAIADPRNGVPACAFHHGQFDNRFLHVPRSAVPDHVEQFAADLGLTWRLDRDHPTTESETE